LAAVNAKLDARSRYGLLTQEMKEILNNGEWLTDKHIMLSQELFRNQVPHIDGL